MNNMLKRLYEFKHKKKSLIMMVLLVVIIPILSSLAFGVEMESNQIELIPTVVYDNDNSAFSRMLIDEVGANDIFDIRYNVNSNEEVEALINSNKAMMGLIIPKDFSQDIISANAPKVLVFYDGSSMSITSAAKARMNEILLTLKAGYMKKVIEGKFNVASVEALKQIQPITPTYRLLYNPTRNYRNFLLPGMLISIAQVIIVILGAEKASLKQKNILSLLFSSVKWGAVGSISLFLALGIQMIFFGLPYRGTILGGIISTLLYSIGIVSLGMLVRLVISNKTFATQVACVMVLPTSILGGYTFPLFAMPNIIEKFGLFLTYNHYANGVRGLLMKPLSLIDIKEMILILAGFLAVIWAGMIVVYLIREKIGKSIDCAEATI